jgi:hypothetical protein
MKLFIRKTALGITVLTLLGAAAARAGTSTFDFNSDPSADGSLTIYGAPNTAWVPYNGVGYATNFADGFLQITPAGPGNGAVVFADFDNGAVVQGFTFECDLRIGNGTADPADGFSINYARANDPVVTTGTGWASNPGCEANLPEEGTTTGIAIGFDAWQSGSGTGCSTVGADVIGISIRIDNVLVSQFPLPTKNGACTDATSLQTGPRDTANPGGYEGLCWAPLKVDLSPANALNVWWKGKQILTNYQATGYFPSPGRLVFAGRTGDANQNQHVDNIRITTIAATIALVGTATGLPDGFFVTIADSGASIVDTTKPVTLTLDGVSVTASSVIKNGATTTITYHGFPTLLSVGSTHSMTVAAQDTHANVITGARTFTVPGYGTLPATDIVASGVDTAKLGFKLRPWQSDGQPNRIYWTEEQLLGLQGVNNADLTTATDGGYVDYTGVINFNINPASVAGGGDAGNFQTGAGYPDSLFPGIPGVNGLNGSSAIELLAFLKFSTAGLYTMGVNSDDGFLVTEGKNPKDRFALKLGSYDGGKGASDVTFTIAVTTPGIYPFRLIWENGNGELPGNGANCEWFTIKDGVKYLINDSATTNTTGISVYYAGPQLPAYVSHLYPFDGATGARADKLVAQLTDGASTVSGSTIRLTVDGTPVNATITKSGTVTTATADITAANMLQPGKRVASLAWSDSAVNSYSNTWSFTVDPWTALDPALSVPLSAADATKTGFTLQIAQLDPGNVGRPDDTPANQIASGDALLGGLYFPYYGSNTVDLVTGGLSGLLPAYSNVWYWNEAMDFWNFGDNVGDFMYNKYFPGLPGVGASADQENFAVWIEGYVALNAGYYRMGISSDDGFRVSEGFGITRQVLHVTGSGVDRDVAAIVSTTIDGNPGFGVPLPTVPITAPVQYMPAVPDTGCPNFPFINLTGKIAVINNLNCYDADLVYQAQQYGAIAVILANDAQWGLPYVLTGTSGGPITVPVLCVSSFAGEEDMWKTNTSLVATIGADTKLKLGAADYGKGMGWVNFNVVVPQTGLYPLHLLYEQGNGGAGFEWAVQYSDSLAWDANSRTLVNDSTDTRSLKAYRDVTQLPRPTMSLVFQGGAWKIVYTGTLQATATLGSNYQDVQSASSPYTLPTGSAPQMFYRARN